GVLLAGSVAYLEAVLAQRTSYAVAMASVAALVFAGAAVVVAVGRERRGVQFGAWPGASPPSVGAEALVEGWGGRRGSVVEDVLLDVVAHGVVVHLPEQQARCPELLEVGVDVFLALQDHLSPIVVVEEDAWGLVEAIARRVVGSDCLRGLAMVGDLHA